jgi:hypothetical protein
LTIRADILLDAQDIDLGTIHLFALFIKEWGGKHAFQLSLSGHYFYYGPDRHRLPSGAVYEALSQHQVTVEAEVAYRRWKPLQPLLRGGYTYIAEKGRAEADGALWPTSRRWGVASIFPGVKTEIALSNDVILWAQLYGGPQRFTGQYPKQKYGWNVTFALGFYFK